MEMALPAGSRLGPYEVVAPIGSGGMGEVYRARDARLGRDVAIKVLPQHLARDPAARARFEREARAVAGLSHPNILAIHDFGVDGETAYSVTELLEGETLRERLDAAALPLRKVLDYGAQIARGLAAAHDKGVIHRDLKPENIFLTEDGQAKILDFGLAKLERPAPDDATASPTIDAGTSPGTVMGTMGYMSPEQVRGQDVDARSDLFSLGGILYEMVSGKRAFRQDTAADTMSAILREDPPALSSVSDASSASLQRIVEHCLEKNPGERFQSARDLAFQLEEIGTGSSSMVHDTLPAASARARGGSRSLIFLGGLLAGVVVGGLLAAQLVRPEPAEPPTLRYLSYTGRETMPSAAPDGRLVAYVRFQGDRSEIWVKQIPGGNEVKLTEGPADGHPRISPDGSQVLFTGVEQGRPALFRVPVVGGPPRKVVDDAQDGDWSPDGERVAFLRSRMDDGGLEFTLGSADAAGHDSRELLTREHTRLASPRWSPDGRTIAVVEGGLENSPFSILVVDAASGQPRVLPSPAPGGRVSSLAWNREGRALIYARSESIMAAEELSGRLIVQDVASGEWESRMWLTTMANHVDVLRPGTVVMSMASSRQNLMEIDVVDGRPAGAPRWLTRGNATDRQPIFSPDGRWMLFSSNRDGNLDLWKLSVETGTIQRITEDPDHDWDPAFSADGEQILWSSNRGGHLEIWICDADGTGARQLTEDGLDAENPTATPDGRWIVYNSGNPEHPGLWRIHPDGSGAELVVPGTWSVPDLSPDGRYVAFRTAAIPRQLLVARLDDGEIVAGPWDLPGSNMNGRTRWMPDGRHLLFVASDPETGARGIMIQEFSPGRDTLATRKPFLGFDGNMTPESLAASPDGRRLIYSAADGVSTLMIAEGLHGIAPAAGDRP